MPEDLPPARRVSRLGETTLAKPVWRWVVGVLVMAAATLAAYLPALQAGYVWDDDVLLTQNPCMEGLAGLKKIWLTLEQPDYLPLTWTSLWLGWQAWGDNPAGHHLVNVLMHVVTAGLLWRVLRRLAAPGAYLAAMVFALHPVNVASVAWVAERKNLVAMTFFLLTVLAYLRYDRGGRWGHLAGAVALYACALLGKASVVMTPLALLGLTWYRRGRLTRYDLLKAAPFAALSLAAAGLTVYTQYHNVIHTEVVFGPGQTLPWRLVGAGWSVWFYLYKALLPVKLAMVYPRWDVDLANIAHYVPLLGVVGALAALGWYRDRRHVRPAALAMGYFVVMLAPVMGFFRMFYMRFALAADHWQHLSIIGLIALGVGAAWWAAQRLGPAARIVGVLLAVAVLATLGTLTWDQSSKYKDRETLWRDNIAKYPKVWQAWFGLGEALARNYDRTGDPRAWEESCRSYRQAVALKPDFHMAHNNLGNLLAGQGRFAEALDAYTRALKGKPDSAVISDNRAGMLWELGRPSEAIGAAELALRWQPDYTPARLSLAEFHVRLGRTREAMRQLREGIRLDPHSDDLHMRLGALLMQDKRTDEAVVEFRAALAVNPHHVGALQNLAVIAAQKGDLPEALKFCDRALSEAPRDVSLLFNRGCVLQKLHRAAEAARDYERAIGMDPNRQEILKPLAWMRAAHPDPALRNGREAMELATRLNELTNYSLADALDVLAAAQAEAGDFEQARQTNRKAAAIAQRVGLAGFAAELAGRDRFYAAGQPLRQELTSDPAAPLSADSQPATQTAPPG